jgi:hypothetical protein
VPSFVNVPPVTTGLGSTGVTELDEAEFAELPFALVALTVNV